MSKPKVHNVYASTADGLGEILSAATGDEPVPTARAAELVEEAHRAGPVLPDSETLPTLSGAGGGGDLLVDDAAPPPDYRQAAENLIELTFAAVPAGDWQPESDAEREELVRALQRVFEVRGIAPNLPPEVTLIVVAGKYTRRRLAKPAVQSKVGPWLARVPLLGKLFGAKPVDPTSTAGGAGAGAGAIANVFDALPRMTPEAG